MAELTIDPTTIRKALDEFVESYKPSDTPTQEVGYVATAGDGIAHVTGLPGCMANELLTFEDGTLGLAFNLGRHQFREFGTVLTLHLRQCGRKNQHIFICIYDHRPHQIFKCEHCGKDTQCNHTGSGQRSHDIQEGLSDITAIQTGCFFEIIRQSHIPLSEQESTERRYHTREYQSKNGVQHPHLAYHQILRCDEDLSRNHHLQQYQ